MVVKTHPVSDRFVKDEYGEKIAKITAENIREWRRDGVKISQKTGNVSH